MGESVLTPIVGIALLLLTARARYRGYFILMFVCMVLSDTAFVMTCGQMFMDGIIPSNGSLLLMEAFVIAAGFLIPKWLDNYWVNRENDRETRQRAEQEARQQCEAQERERRIAACREEIGDLRSVYGFDLTPFLVMLQLNPPDTPGYASLVQEHLALRHSLTARAQALNQESQELGLNIRA